MSPPENPQEKELKPPKPPRYIKTGRPIGRPKGIKQPPRAVQEVKQGALSRLTFDPNSLEALKAKSFGIWVNHANITVDNRPLSFPDHKYLIPLYRDMHPYIVVMKAAQLGLTVWLMLRLLWHCLYSSVKASLYFPTKDGVEKMTKDRLNPLIYTNPSLLEMLNQREDSLGLKRFHNNSSLYMSYLGGTVSKDSTPLDVMGIDEVRLIAPEDIDQAMERLSHSLVRIKYMASTAGYPNHDIHKRFMGSDQHYFHTNCKCPDGVVLSEVFPNCVAERNNGQIYLECPKCKTIITDPQNGRFLAHEPKNEIRGYHIHQMLSRYIPLRDIWLSYKTTSNIKEFFNAKLGKPFVEDSDKPINEEVLTRCTRNDFEWDTWYTENDDLAMGVDQMKGLNVVVIAQRWGPRKRIVHLEWIENSNPFERLYELMQKFPIKICVIDALPSANEAYNFAKTFDNKVFLAFYRRGEMKDMVMWYDKSTPKVKKSKKLHSQDTRQRYKVDLNRYQSLDYTFKQFERGLVEIPNPRGLMGQVTSKKTGRKEPTLICEDLYFEHLQSVVREQVVINKETGQYRMDWIELAEDPHFVHATNYAFFGLEKIRPSFKYTFF